ncbi:MAG: hypothetical protein HY905_04790 [Deltaproteobacteria bacterium]|nr:hypothetical protein [Deltaproteobacteria bacterium]
MRADTVTDEELAALAHRAGLLIGDLQVRPSHAEDVTNEAFAASQRRRLEAAGAEYERAERAELRRRLAWAGDNVPFRKAVARGSEHAPDAARGTAEAARVSEDGCYDYCLLLRRCNGPEEEGDWPGCLASCGRGEFGSETRLLDVVAVASCDHL